MNIKNFFNQLTQNPTKAKIAILVAIFLIWTGILIAITVGLFLVTFEESGQTLEPTPGGIAPVIVLEPATGPVGAFVTIQGQGWPAGSVVLIYLTAPDDTEIPAYAIAGSVVDQAGQFVAAFTFPSEPRWQNQNLATITAQADNGVTALASFTIVSQETQPTPTPTLLLEPSATPTVLVAPTPLPPTEMPTPTPEPPSPTPEPPPPTPEP